MSEYTNKNDLISFLDNLKQPRNSITEGFKFITIDDAIRIVSERPTADVIEREKIDKAIEEMEIEYNNLEYTENHNKGASYGIRKSMEILKRNIGDK